MKNKVRKPDEKELAKKRIEALKILKKWELEAKQDEVTKKKGEIDE